MKKLYQNGVRLLLEAFPEFKKTDKYRKLILQDPQQEEIWIWYGDFNMTIIEPLLKGNVIAGITIKDIVNFINDVYNDSEVDGELISVISMDWLDPISSVLETPKLFKDYKRELLLVFKNGLRGRALQEMKWRLKEIDEVPEEIPIHPESSLYSKYYDESGKPKFKPLKRVHISEAIEQLNKDPELHKQVTHVYPWQKLRQRKNKSKDDKSTD